MERRKEFESRLDIEKTLYLCRLMCKENDEDVEEYNLADVFHQEADPFLLFAEEQYVANVDVTHAALQKLGAVVRSRENLLPLEDFYDLMRLCNKLQKRLSTHTIYHLLTPLSPPLQIFLTGVAGCGKSFFLKILKEIYNRLCPTDNHHNSYVACASTGRAAVNIDGLTVHTALKIPANNKCQLLNYEKVALYRTLFKYVKVLIIDGVSMIGAKFLMQIDSRLKQITGNYNRAYGEMDVFFCRGFETTSASES